MSNFVYSLITQQMIELLEKGVVPWHKPWHVVANSNIISRKAYRGVNVFLTALANRSTPWWMTYKQAKDLGGYVKKGEHGTIVIFWKTFKPRTERDDEEEVRIPILRYYKLFNLDQTEDIPPAKVPPTPHFDWVPLEKAESVVEGMPNRPQIELRGSNAYYDHMTDVVRMPRKPTFEDAEHWYATLFHELAHSTVHPSRLHRTRDRAMLESCSREELLAEMGSAMLCGICKIAFYVLQNQASYIANWLKVFHDDKTIIVKAASQAQKAADYIQGIEPAEQKELDHADVQAKSD